MNQTKLIDHVKIIRDAIKTYGKVETREAIKGLINGMEKGLTPDSENLEYYKGAQLIAFDAATGDLIFDMLTSGNPFDYTDFSLGVAFCFVFGNGKVTLREVK